MLSRHLAVAAALAALILIASQLGLYRNSVEKERSTQWVTQTYEAIRALESIPAGIAAAEAALRGFAINQDPRFLPSFDEGTTRARRGLARSLELTAENPRQRRRLGELAPRLEVRLSQLASALSLAKQGRPLEEVTPRDRVVRTGEVRASVDAAVQDERQLLEQRLRRGLEQTIQAQHTSLVGALVALVLSALVFYLVSKHASRLREAEEELRLTVDNAPIGMALIAPDGRWLRVNDALCQILGRERAELLGTPSQQNLHPDDRERTLRTTRRLLAGEIASYAGEARYLRHDGSVVWVNAAVSMVRPAPRRAAFLIVQMQDVSARRSAEAEARTFFAQSVDMLAIDSTPTRLQKINDAWERTLGWSREELTSASLLELVHKDDRDKTLREAEAIEQGHPSRAFRARYRAKNDRYHWLDWRMHRSDEGRLFCIARDTTEETEREHALHTYKRALAAAESAVILTDATAADNTIAYVNPAFEKMTGYTAQEIIGQNCRFLQGNDRDQPGIAALREAIRQRRDCQAVVRNYKKDGEMFRSAVSVSPVRDSAGHLTHFIGIADDITDRERELEQTRLLAELTRMMVEASDIGSALHTTLRDLCESQGWDYGEFWFPGDESGVLVRHVASFERDELKTGSFRDLSMQRSCHSGETLPGRVWSTGRAEWHEDLRETDESSSCRIEAAVSAGLHACVGVPLFVQDGVEGVLVLLRGTPAPRDERVLHVLATIGGQLGMLIQHKRAIEALRTSEERLSLASRATSDVLYDWNIAGDARWFGEALSRNFGYEPRVVPMVWWSSRLHPDEQARVQATLAEAIESPQQTNWAAEYRFRTDAGHYTHVFDRGFIVREASGKAVRVIGSMMDISDRVRNEEVLREAKDAAEAAGRAKSSFLANMSHEIRTPLTALLGFADLMLDPKLGASDRLNYAMTIRRNGEHLLSVLNDILDVSRVEAGKLSVETIECSPANVLAEVASLMRVRASEKKLAFGVEYETPVPATVRSDPTRMRQILLNLVSNAVKFTHEGGVRVRVRYAEEGSGESGELTVHVADTGIGMDAEQVARIFKPFAQADASMTRRFGGSGLGLAICAPLAKIMGGTLDVDTAPGRGSTFTLSLPVERVADSPMLSDPTEVLTGAETGVAREPVPRKDLGGSVLLAEDGYDNQVLISTLLRKQGFAVDVVENGLLAVEHATRAESDGRPYDVVLMDMQMPELDGYGATARLRAQGYTLPIVALTAHAMTGERERCIAAGCDEYLSKPIQRSRLVHTVSTYVKRSGRSTPTPTLPPSLPPTSLMPRAPSNENRGPTTQAAPTPDAPAPPAPQTAPLVSHFADDPDIAALVTTFVAGIPAQAQAMQDAAQRGDRALLMRLAHQLKGAAGGYGFPSISKAAGHLEQLTKQPAAALDEGLAAVVSLCARTQLTAAAAQPKLASQRASAPSLLLIDDSAETHALVAARLAPEGVNLRNALTAREGLTLAFGSPPDLVLLDLDLPDVDGFAVCRELKNDARTAHVPVLFLTGTEDPAVKANALDLGAIDYVTKPFDPTELRARVRAALRTKRYHDLLMTRAQLDGLTGLWNRAHFDERLKEELSASLRYGHAVSIALLDLDHFKRINDTFGHPFGDQVLQGVAAALIKTLRTSDVACRYGGEELVVILRETPAAEAMKAAERLRKAIAELTLTARGERVYISASIGVAATPPAARASASLSPATLVAAADAALYQAKQQGRNRVVFGPLDAEQREPPQSEGVAMGLRK